MAPEIGDEAILLSTSLRPPTPPVAEPAIAEPKEDTQDMAYSDD